MGVKRWGSDLFLLIVAHFYQQSLIFKIILERTLVDVTFKTRQPNNSDTAPFSTTTV